MRCPICKKSTFIEVDNYEDGAMYMQEISGWSIKECLNCGYKVKDLTNDGGRFVRIDHVINKPNLEVIHD